LLHAWVESPSREPGGQPASRLGKQPIGSFFTCLVMAVALSLPMGLSLLLNNVERLGGSWQRAAQISLYLQLDASSDCRRGLCSEQIKEPAGGGGRRVYQPRPGAGRVPAAVRAWARRSRSCRENPLPGVVLVTPNEVDKTARLRLFVSKNWLNLPKVQQAQLDLVWVERLAAILKLGDRFRVRPDGVAGFCFAAGDRQYDSSSYRKPPHRDRGD
jgi:cell division transport system permease protein